MPASVQVCGEEEFVDEAVDQLLNLVLSRTQDPRRQRFNNPQLNDAGVRNRERLKRIWLNLIPAALFVNKDAAAVVAGNGRVLSGAPID